MSEKTYTMPEYGVEIRNDAAYNAEESAGTLTEGQVYDIVGQSAEIYGGAVQTSAPTTSTVGNAGDIYIALISGNYRIWDCIAANGGVYTWRERIRDVQVAGTTVTADGVANIPRATGSLDGAVKVSTSYGMQISAGFIYPIHATDAKITARASDANGSIMPSNVDFAVKAALTDGVGAAYTTAEQTAARTRIGAQQALTISADWDS